MGVNARNPDPPDCHGRMDHRDRRDSRPLQPDEPQREASLFAPDHFTGSKSFSRDGTFASISLAISSACADAWAAVCLGSGLKSTPTTWIRRECCSVPSKMAENP